MNMVVRFSSLLACIFFIGVLKTRSFAAETVFISEFLASNQGGLQDEDGASPDWIEIFNSGTNTVNMNGWYLTDNAATLTKWRFPATNIPPSGFLIVFASGKKHAGGRGPLRPRFHFVW